MKAAFLTLGCKVNQYETQAMEALLKKKGHTVVPFDKGADAYIINTCTVTSTADKKSRNAVRRARRLSPGAIVAVCGCFSQASPEDARSLGADLVYGSGDRAGFIEKLDELFRTGKADAEPDDAMGRRDFEPLPPGGMSGRTRALLKVEDGCSNFCTYCIIPFARGPVRSISLSDAAERALELRAAGYKEIVLTGIELASYGRDLPGKPSPADLFETVCSAVPDVRIRLGSLEPRCVDEAFCSKLSRCGNLCGHFHLSLQSGCDETLKRMGRKYDTSRFYESVLLLRGTFPGCAITADLITGFPGETPREFSQTLEFIEKCAFASMHIFPYSERAGTKAAGLPGRVPLKERERRSHEASLIASAMRRTYLEGQIGSVQNVLYESRSGSVSYGHAPNNAVVSAQGDLRGRIVPTLITGSDGTALQGEPISGSARREERG
jgi:threonylcarbamoyladenosine tRNA methylthiotransferase MtaB